MAENKQEKEQKVTKQYNKTDKKARNLAIGLGVGLGVPLLVMTGLTTFFSCSSTKTNGGGGTSPEAPTKWVEYTDKNEYADLNAYEEGVTKVYSDNIVKYEPSKDYANSSIFDTSMLAELNSNLFNETNKEKIVLSLLGLIGYNIYSQTRTWTFPVEVSYGCKISITSDNCIAAGSEFGCQVKEKNSGKVQDEVKISFTKDCNAYMLSDVSENDLPEKAENGSGYIVLAAKENRYDSYPIFCQIYAPYMGQTTMALYEPLFPFVIQNGSATNAFPNEKNEVSKNEFLIPRVNTDPAPAIKLSDVYKVKDNAPYTFNDLSFYCSDDRATINENNEIVLKDGYTWNGINYVKVDVLFPKSLTANVSESIIGAKIADDWLDCYLGQKMYEDRIYTEHLTEAIGPYEVVQGKNKIYSRKWDNYQWNTDNSSNPLLSDLEITVNGTTEAYTKEFSSIQRAAYDSQEWKYIHLNLKDTQTLEFVGYVNPSAVIPSGSHVSPNTIDADRNTYIKTDIKDAVKNLDNNKTATLDFTGTEWDSTNKKFKLSAKKTEGSSGATKKIDWQVGIFWKITETNYNPAYGLTIIEFVSDEE